MKSKTKHTVPPEELMAFIDGQLEKGRRDQVAAHLNGCPECRSLLETLGSVDQRVAEVEKAEAPEGYFDTFASRVSSRIAQRRLTAARPRPAWFLRWGWMPTAAVVVLAVVVVMSIDYRREMNLGTQRLAEKAVPKPLPETKSVEKGQSHLAAPAVRPSAAPPAEVARDKEIAAVPVATPPATPAAGIVGTTDELVESQPDLAASRVETAPAPALAGKMSSAKEKKEVDLAKAAGYASEEAKTAPSTRTTEPDPAAPPAMDLELRRSAAARAPAVAGPAKSDAGKSKDARQPRLARTKPRVGDTVVRNAAAALDVGPADVSEVEAIVIYVPDHNDSLPPPEVRRTIRIEMR